MPTIQLPGQPPTVVTDQQLSTLRILMPGVPITVLPPVNQTPFAAPAPTNTNTLGKRKLPTGTTSAPSNKTPCQIAEEARARGQAQVIINALDAKCRAYKEATQFAAQASPPPLNEQQLASMAVATTADEPAPAGMSKGLKIALIAGGALVVIGGIAYFATRR